MTKLIVADIQPIYRAGIVRLLAPEADFRIVAQCSDIERTLHAITTFPGSVVLIASGLHPEWPRVKMLLEATGSRGIVIAENSEVLDAFAEMGMRGVLYRGSTSTLLLECLRTVAVGGIWKPRLPENIQLAAEDGVGMRVRERLTPKEMRIMALIVQGCKNREIAFRLNTTEQVVKNYLRSIYDKTGVSDRLELALFTLHHRVLAEATAEIGVLMEQEEMARLHAAASKSTEPDNPAHSMRETGT